MNNEVISVKETDFSWIDEMRVFPLDIKNSFRVGFKLFCFQEIEIFPRSNPH
jgi:hypothetical protein